MRAKEPGTTRLGRFARRWRFDHNPLRRGTDRIESTILALLVAAFLIGAPFAALAAGAAVHGAARQAQLAQEASRRQVTAVVLTVDASSTRDLIWQVQARWTAPDGREVTYEVPVPSGTEPGQKIEVWSDLRGDLSTAPLLDSQVSTQTALAEIATVPATAAVLSLAGALALCTLNRRRMAAWDADWHVTGPRWTTRA